MYQVPTLPLATDIETKPVMRQLARAHQALGNLNGVSKLIPKEEILINTLVRCIYCAIIPQKSKYHTSNQL